MRRFFTLLLLVGLSLTAWAQGGSALEQLRQDPRKSYGNDYPYLFETVQPHVATNLSISAIMPVTAPGTTGTRRSITSWTRS